MRHLYYLLIGILATCCKMQEDSSYNEYIKNCTTNTIVMNITNIIIMNICIYYIIIC